MGETFSHIRWRGSNHYKFQGSADFILPSLIAISMETISHSHTIRNNRIPQNNNNKIQNTSPNDHLLWHNILEIRLKLQVCPQGTGLLALQWSTKPWDSLRGQRWQKCSLCKIKLAIGVCMCVSLSVLLVKSIHHRSSFPKVARVTQMSWWDNIYSIFLLEKYSAVPRER